MIMTAKSELSDKLGVICRICLKEDGPMVSIFTENDNQPILATKITSIAQVQVSPGDGLPVSICRTCHQRIDKFHDFRLLVEISDRTLRAYLVETEESEKTFLRCTDDVGESDHQPYLEESNLPDEARDTIAVNAILVPLETRTEVWQICGVEEHGPGEEEVRETAGVKTRDIQTNVSENSADIADSNGNVAAETYEHFSRRVQPIAIVGNSRNEDPLFFTMTKNDDEIEGVTNVSEHSVRATIMKDEKDEDPHGSYARPSKYSCQLCLKSFETLRSLKGHVKEHFLCGKRRMQICGMAKNKLGWSRRSPHDDGNSGRDGTTEAPRTYRATEELLVAREEQANESEEENRAGVVTEKGIPNVDEAITEDSSLTCTTCNKHFRSSQTFKMHLKRHTLGSRFSCLECGKGYYSNSELARHAQLHTGMREYPCHLCGMSFFSRPELNRHTKYHNGEKKFQCKMCSKTYYESGHLKVHERVHTGEKPFACIVCEKAFITKSKLMRHCKIHARDRAS